MTQLEYGTIIWLAFVVVWSYTVIQMFGYDSIDGQGEPKIIIENEEDEL